MQSLRWSSPRWYLIWKCFKEEGRLKVVMFQNLVEDGELTLLQLVSKTNKEEEDDDDVMNCFCGMVDRRKACNLISCQNHCQRSSPSRISGTLRTGFEPAQDLSSAIIFIIFWDLFFLPNFSFTASETMRDYYV